MMYMVAISYNIVYTIWLETLRYAETIDLFVYNVLIKLISLDD